MHGRARATSRLLVMALLLGACAGGGPRTTRAADHAYSSDSAERAAVLAVIDRLFAAMESKDTAAFAELMTDDGISYIQAPRDGRWRLLSRSHREFAAGLADSDADWSERYWQPTVLVRGPIAVVWTPYEFRRDGERSHCGVDAFSLVQVDGQWRIGAAMWTIEPAACVELGAPAPAAPRPH